MMYIYPFSLFFFKLRRSLVYWGKNDHVLNLSKFYLGKFIIKNSSINHNNISKFYKKPYAYFTKHEKQRGGKSKKKTK